MRICPGCGLEVLYKSGDNTGWLPAHDETEKEAAGLAIDVGGSHVKVRVAKSGMSANSSQVADERSRMVRGVLKVVGEWKYDVLSIGYPGCHHGKIVTEPIMAGAGGV